MPMTNKFFLPAFVLFSLIYAGCNDDTIFQKKIEIRKEGWSYDDRLIFDFTIEDTLKKYNLLLDVEHNGDYGFQNLYVRFHTTYPSGETKTQTVSLELADKRGLWNGKCRGNTCTVEIPLQVNATFKEKGTYRIAIEQYMRKNPLPGIKGMVLKITPVKS